MCVRCISDWLDETQPSKLHTPNIDTIRGTLRRNAFRFSFCLHSSALYLRQLAARAHDETSSQAKTPLAGSRAGPSLAGLALSFRQSRQSTLRAVLQPTVFHSIDPPMHNDARRFGIVIQRLPAKAVFVVFATALRIDFPHSHSSKPSLQVPSPSKVPSLGQRGRRLRFGDRWASFHGPAAHRLQLLFSQLHSSTHFPPIAESSTVPTHT